MSRPHSGHLFNWSHFPELDLQSFARPVLHVVWLGRQPSSAAIFAFDAPRIVVIHIVNAFPIISRATNAGTRSGRGAPIAAAYAGIHSAAGVGSSSTTL